MILGIPYNLNYFVVSCLVFGHLNWRHYQLYYRLLFWEKRDLFNCCLIHSYICGGWRTYTLAMFPQLPLCLLGSLASNLWWLPILLQNYNYSNKSQQSIKELDFFFFFFTRNVFVIWDFLQVWKFWHWPNYCISCSVVHTWENLVSLYFLIAILKFVEYVFSVFYCFRLPFDLSPLFRKFRRYWQSKPTKPINDVGKTQQVELRPKACTPIYIYISENKKT